jgi:hypothetical protein
MLMGMVTLLRQVHMAQEAIHMVQVEVQWEVLDMVLAREAVLGLLYANVLKVLQVNIVNQ